VAVPHCRGLRVDLAGACGCLAPLVSRLAGRGFLVRAGWILLYGGAEQFGYLLFLTGAAAINEIQQLAHNVSAQDAWKLPAWLEGSPSQWNMVSQLPPPSKFSQPSR